MLKPIVLPDLLMHYLLNLAAGSETAPETDRLGQARCVSDTRRPLLPRLPSDQAAAGSRAVDGQFLR